MYDNVIRRWLDVALARPDLAPSTKSGYARVASILVAYRPTNGRHLIEDYVAARRAAGAAPRTLALELRVLSAATHWASRQPGGQMPPALPRIRIDPKSFVLNHRTPTPAQAAAVIRAMKNDTFRLVARLLAATGARIGEALALRSLDFDASAGRIALGGCVGARKTGLRWFPLDAATLRQLAGRDGRGTAPLFDFGHVTSPFQAFQRRLREACDTAGVPRFTPHALRRMVVGRLLRANVDPATAASLTGHSIEVMLKYYRDVTDEDRQIATERAMLGVLDELPRGR